MWNELIYIHSFVIFWRYVWTCDWKMLGLWFELGLKHLLSRHLSRKHCCIFPASTTTSKLTSPFHVVKVNISLLFLVLLFLGFLVHGLVRITKVRTCLDIALAHVCFFTHWSAAFSKQKTRFAMFCEFQKNFCILTTYNISPCQASKEENRKHIWNAWFFHSEKVNFPKLLASSFSTIFKHHWKNLAELGNFFTSYNSSKFSSRTCKTCDIYKAVTPNL